MMGSFKIDIRWDECTFENDKPKQFLGFSAFSNTGHSGTP
jgi:hypothetical protein